MYLIGKSNFTLIMLLVLASGGLLAQNFDSGRMNRDLEIMERILDRILEDGSGFTRLRSNTQGVHIPNYGVIFQVDQSSSLRLIRRFGGSSSAVVVAPRAGSGARNVPQPDEQSALTPDSILNRAHQQIGEFFSNYVNAIGQLQEDDRILALIHFGGSEIAFFERRGRRTAPDLPEFMAASISKKAVNDLRGGKLSEQQFLSRIKFSTPDDPGNIQRDIKILSEIFDTSLDRKHHRSFGLRDQTNGIYVPGLGAIFFMKGTVFGEGREDRVNIIVDQIIDNEPIILEENIERRNNQEDAVERYKVFRSALMQVVADYGHTLRVEGQNELLVLSLDINSFGLPNQVVMSIPLAEVQRFHAGKSSGKALESKFVVQEY